MKPASVGTPSLSIGGRPRWTPQPCALKPRAWRGSAGVLLASESGRHATWLNKFTAKLRADQHSLEADFAILSSNVFPAGARELHIQDILHVERRTARITQRTSGLKGERTSCEFPGGAKTLRWLVPVSASLPLLYRGFPRHRPADRRADFGDKTDVIRGRDQSIKQGYQKQVSTKSTFPGFVIGYRDNLV